MSQWSEWYQRNQKRQFAKIMAYRKIRHASNRKWLDGLKEGQTCLRCGFSNPAALQWHHLRDKKFEIANALRLGLGRIVILAELKKCELICANCHFIEHARA